MVRGKLDDDLGSVASLGDPRRRALYRYVIEHGPGVSRDEAARGVGVSRALAAYHLDRLVDDGLLGARYERTGGRTGPGAGRPSKLYERSGRHFEVQLPPRDYELAARLFARTLDRPTGPEPRTVLLDTARRFGAELAVSRARGMAGVSRRPDAALDVVMRDLGYEPVEAQGTVRLRNCPFDALTDEHRELVCGMNLALLEGLVQGLGVDLEPVLDPRAGHCCVALIRRPTIERDHQSDK